MIIFQLNLHQLTTRAFFVALCFCASVSLSGCYRNFEPCCAANLSAPAAVANVPATSETFVKTELYFGLSQTSGPISEETWSGFVDQHITPSFSDGLTVLDAKGQWKNQSGQIVKENSKLVILIYKPNHDKDAAIDSIIAAYKKQFQQESVLRVTTAATVSF